MRKGEESRQRIIRCAAELFWSRGYHATGMNDILSLVGLPRGSFYFHFGSKKELASAVISYYDSVLLDKFRDSAAGRAWPEFIDGVFGLLKGRADSGTFRGCPFAVMGMELAVSEPELAAQYSSALSEVQNLFRSVLLFSGLSPEQADVLAERMLFIYQGGVLRTRISGDTGYLQRLKSAMKDTFTQYRALCCVETGGSI